MALQMREKDPFRLLKIILRRGFLSNSIRIGGATILIKQVTPEEIWRWSYSLPCAGDGKASSRYLKAGIVAMGMVLWRGKNLLVGRPENIGSLAHSLSKWPEVILSGVYEDIQRLTLAYYNQLPLVYTFASEVESRMLWSSCSHCSMNDPVWSGWQGTQHLETGLVEKVWRFLQTRLDFLDGFELMWQNTKCLVACISSEGFKEMNRIEKLREEQRKNLGRYSHPSRGEKVQDLVDELHRSLSGELDSHDFAIQNEEGKILEGYLEEEKRLQELHKDFLDTFMPNVISESREVRGVSSSRRISLTSGDNNGILGGGGV